ncbi:hypothetical protein [Desulfobulbus oralis]|uniref:hypothetical protein n=1 Tax=Desulfobulbus oralis TaxID=1986146 RepID=UPI0011AFFCFB|nr:hypothetical protein [Desulfobulbus oralis]
MAEQQADRAVPTRAAPAKKQRNTLLVLACAVIFWMYTIFLIVHPLLMGLQYSFWVVLGYLAYRNFILEDLEYPVCPYQDKVVARWRQTYFYRLLYVNTTQKESWLPFCRAIFYLCIIGSIIITMIRFLSPLAINRDTYYEKGYIEKIEPIDRLSLCGSAIIYIKNFNGISKKMYINLSEKKFNELNNYDEFTFEISYSKANRVLMCGNYNYIYSLKKNDLYILKINADLREKVDAFFTSIFFLCFFMSIIWLIPFFSTYDKRNSTS